MRLTLQNHIVCADYGQVHLDARVVGQIIDYTAETWQPDRPKKERECNIEQGKIAEEITEQFIRQYYSQELSLKTYDEIRNDDFKKHAPFDFLLWKTGTVNIAFIEEAIRQDIARTPNKFVKLSNVTRRLCRTLGVKIVEVKSTNIRNDLKVESDFTGDYDNVKSVQKLLETIRRKDDVFCYPKLKRRESDPGYCLDDYCREVQERFSEFDGCKGENLRRRVIAWECENQCCDIFVRVYLDRPAKKGFVIGWMQKEELFDGKRVFENVKPVNVIQYFINMAAKDGDIVMDFFSGSATTAHAVMQTEADKNIDLHYILVQIPQECDKKSEAYKAGYKTICEIGKERIRRAAEKIKRENGCENRDFGFRVLRLDESNMEDVYYMPEEYTQEMLYGLETNIKPDRTDLDLLFACLTEWGLLLSKPYSSEKISGYTVHYYDGKELAACFNENISETVIRKIAGQHPRRAVFCDASFSDSAAKINMSELFRTISPETQIKVI